MQVVSKSMLKKIWDACCKQINKTEMLSLKFPWSYEISWTQDHFISGQLCVVSVIYVHKSSQVNVKSFLWVFWTGQNQFFANVVLRWRPKITKRNLQPLFFKLSSFQFKHFILFFWLGCRLFFFHLKCKVGGKFKLPLLRSSYFPILYAVLKGFLTSNCNVML